MIHAIAQSTGRACHQVTRTAVQPFTRHETRMRAQALAE
jgi:hypothetical protein